MTTEQHAFRSQRVAHVDAPRPAATAPVCGCGQDLDLVVGRHCPRCGTSLVGHAA
jgi:hypothetical protein